MVNLQDMLQHAHQYEREGQLNEAGALCRKILDHYPEQFDALHMLGLIAHKQGASFSAIEFIERAIRANPAISLFHHNLGIINATLGNYGAAIENFEAALKISPDLIHARNNLGSCLGKVGRYEEAVEHYRAIVRLKPDYINAWLNLGAAYRLCDQEEQALSMYVEALKINPNSCEAHSRLGFVLRSLGRNEEGIAHQRQALTIDPRFVEGWSDLGLALMYEGKIEEAIAAQRHAIEINPVYAKAYYEISKMKRYQSGDPDVDVMERLVQEGRLSEEMMTYLYFGLGKAYEDIGDIDKAFGFYERGNKLKRKTIDYRNADEKIFFKHLEDIFSPDFFARRQGLGDESQAPIFIVGMPRSGTTLVEQIVSSHPQVFGAGEINHLKDVLFSSGSKLAASLFPGGVEDLNKTDIEKFAAEYMGKLRAHSHGKRYITNKMPSNYLYVGLIWLMFPNAKIIHCRRDPVDTCLSCYKQLFSGFIPYTWDLRELGQRYRLYDRLMEHWHKVLPGYIYDLQYEELVNDMEGQTRRVLEYCDLTFEPECLDFHTAERLVKTASVAQVRRPVYKDAVKRWKAYETHLTPLLESLAGE